MQIETSTLRESPLFREATTESLDSLARAGKRLSLAKQAVVLGRGDDVDTLYLICEGGVKQYLLSNTGNARILRILGGGDSFGEEWLFDARSSPLYTETLSDTSLACFPRETILALLREDPAFGIAVVVHLGNRVNRLLGDIEACCLMSARQRTAAYLLGEAGSRDRTTATLEFPATKAVIASLLDLTPETFSRELHGLQQLGAIRIERRQIEITDRSILRDLAEAARTRS